MSSSNSPREVYATPDPQATQRSHLLEQVRRREVAIIRAIVRGEVSPTDVKPSVLLTARGVRDSEAEEELKRSMGHTTTREVSPGSARASSNASTLALTHAAPASARNMSGPKMVAPLRPRPPPALPNAAGGAGDDDQENGLYVRKGADRVAVLFGHNNLSSSTRRVKGSSAFTASAVVENGDVGAAHGSSSRVTPADVRLGHGFIRLESLPVPKPNAPPLDVVLTWEDIWPRGASLYNNTPRYWAHETQKDTPKGGKSRPQKLSPSSIFDENGGRRHSVADPKESPASLALSTGLYTDASHASFADTLPVLMQRWKEGARRLVHPSTIYLPSYNPDELNMRVQTTNTINNTLFSIGQQGHSSAGIPSAPTSIYSGASPNVGAPTASSSSPFGVGGVALSNTVSLFEPEFAKVRQVLEAVDKVLLFNRNGRPKPPSMHTKPISSPPQPQSAPTPAPARSMGSDVPSLSTALIGPSGAVVERPEALFNSSSPEGGGGSVNPKIALDEEVDALANPIKGHLRDLQALAFALNDVAAVGFQKNNSVGAAVMLIADQIRMSLHKLHKAWRDDEGPVAEAKTVASRVRYDMQYLQREVTTLRRDAARLEEELGEKTVENALLMQQMAVGAGGSPSGSRSGGRTGLSSAVSLRGGTSGSADAIIRTTSSSQGFGFASTSSGAKPSGSPPKHQAGNKASVVVVNVVSPAATIAEVRSAVASYGKEVAEKSQRRRDEAVWEVVDEDAATSRLSTAPQYAMSVRRVEAKVAAMGRAKRRPVVTIDTGTSCEDLYYTAFTHKIPATGDVLGAVHSASSFMTQPTGTSSPPPPQAVSPVNGGNTNHFTPAHHGTKHYYTNSGQRVSPYASTAYNLFMPRDDLTYLLRPETLLGPRRDRMTRLGSRLVAQACAELAEHWPLLSDASSGDQLQWGFTSLLARHHRHAGGLAQKHVAQEVSGVASLSPTTAKHPPNPSQAQSAGFCPSDFFKGLVNALETIAGRKLSETNIYALMQRQDLSEALERETQTTPSLMPIGIGTDGGGRWVKASARPTVRGDDKRPSKSTNSGKGKETASFGKNSASYNEALSPSSPRLSKTRTGSSSGQILGTDLAGLSSPQTLLQAGTARQYATSPFEIPNRSNTSHAKAILQQIPQMISVANAFKGSNARRNKGGGGANGSGTKLAGGGSTVATCSKEMSTMADRYTITFPKILTLAPLTLEHLLNDLVPAFEEAIEDGLASVVLRGSSGCEDASSPFFLFVSQDNLRSAILETLLFVSVEKISEFSTDERGADESGEETSCLGLGRLLYETLVLVTHLKHGGNDGQCLAWLNAMGVAIVRHITRTYAHQRRSGGQAQEGNDECDKDRGDADTTEDHSLSDRDGDDDHTPNNNTNDPKGNGKRQVSSVSALFKTLKSLGELQYGIGRLWEMEHIAVVHGNEKVVDARQTSRKAQIKVELARAALTSGGSLGGSSAGVGGRAGFGGSLFSSVADAAEERRSLCAAHDNTTVANREDSKVTACSKRDTILPRISFQSTARGGGEEDEVQTSKSGQRHSSHLQSVRTNEFDQQPLATQTGLSLLSASAAGLNSKGSSCVSRDNSVLSAHHEARHLSELSAGAMFPIERVSSQFVTAMFLRWSARGFLAERSTKSRRATQGRAQDTDATAREAPSEGFSDTRGVFLPDSHEHFTATTLKVFVSLLHATIALLDGPRVDELFNGSLFLEVSEAAVLLLAVVPFNVVETAAHVQKQDDKRAEFLVESLLRDLFDAPLPRSFAAMSHVGTALHWDTFALRIVLGWSRIVEPIYGNAAAALMVPVYSLRPWRAVASDFTDATATLSSPAQGGEVGQEACAGSQNNPVDNLKSDPRLLLSAHVRNGAASALSRAVTPAIVLKDQETGDGDLVLSQTASVPHAFTTEGAEQRSAKLTDLPTLSVTAADET